MIGYTPITSRGVIRAMICAALCAIILSGVGAYLLTRFGYGVVSDGRGVTGREVFCRAALNLYAMQHVTVTGNGEIGKSHKVSADVTLPITVYAAAVALALMLAGYIGGRMIAGGSRNNAAALALGAGLIYMLVLVALSPIVRSNVDSSALPSFEMNGSLTEINPPQILFKPDAVSAAQNMLLFGWVFIYLGALPGVRAGRREWSASQWWACTKAMIVPALVFQILLMSVAGVLVMRKAHKDGASGARVAELLPSAAAIGYSLAHGSTLSAAMESTSSLQSLQKPFSARLNLYSGLQTQTGNERNSKPLASYKYILTLFAAIAAVASGWLAISWGSRDGALPTALRVVIVQSIYIIIINCLSGLAWGLRESVGQLSMGLDVSIAPHLSVFNAYAAGGVLILVTIGALLAGSRRRHDSIGF